MHGATAYVQRIWTSTSCTSRQQFSPSTSHFNPGSDLEALRVPIIGVGALVRAGARGAPSESNTSTLPPTSRSTTRRRRRGGSRNSAGGASARGASARGASAGLARGAGGGAAARAGRGRTSDAEPIHISSTVDGDVVGDASSVGTDQVGTVHVLGVPGRRAVGDYPTMSANNFLFGK